MPLSTVVANDVFLLSDQVLWGTMMLNDDFGAVMASSVKRTGDKKEIENGAGNLKSFLLTKPRFELSFDTIFDATVEAPGKGHVIAFPLVGVQGRVLDVTVKYEKAKERMLTIEATSWDALSSDSLYASDDGETWAAYDPAAERIGLNAGGGLRLNAGGDILLNP